MNPFDNIDVRALPHNIVVELLEMFSLNIPRKVGPSYSLDRTDSLNGVVEISHELLSTLMDETK